VKVLFISAEVAPYVSVGGLSQVMYFLPRALKQLGNDLRVFTARYGSMSEWKLKPEISDLKILPSLTCSVSSFAGRKDEPETFFLENNEYFGMRENVFGYKDDHVRFYLLSIGCLEWLLTSDWRPDIIHCNDWHTGYFIELARTNKKYKKFLAKIPIVLTVHNFHYQGNYDFRYLKEDRDTGKEPLEPILSEKLQRQNALLRGLLYADGINTVSPTHAVEVLTKEYEEGLGDVLYAARGKLIGILNGLDSKEFNPSTDLIIKRQFSVKSFVKAREKNKKDLQREFSLPVNSQFPLLAISGRLSQQKGLDLLLPVLDHLLSVRADVQVIALGSGENFYYDRLIEIKRNFTQQVGLHLRADFRLPRKIFAGADIILVPSIFEPGGIVALEALRYGAVPVVRRTGGLNDIITDFNPNTQKGNGFSFTNKDEWALFAAITEALTTYKNKTLWRELIRNCMLCDFSWENSAKEYEQWYERVIEERRRATGFTPHPAYGAIAEKSSVILNEN